LSDGPRDAHSYIIRFLDEAARDAFTRAVRADEDLSGVRLDVGEFLPDVVVIDASEDTIRRLEKLAGAGARVFEDFGHDLFRG